MFVDAGAFIGLYARRDQYSERAMAIWHELQPHRSTLRTTDFVVAETLNLLGKVAGPQAAAQAGLAIYRQLTVMAVEQADVLTALDWMRRYADQRFSFVDCTSFVVMRRLGLKRAFTFDHHFAIAGFEVWPA